MVLRGGGPSSISNYKKVHILGTGLVPQLGTPPLFRKILVPKIADLKEIAKNPLNISNF